MTNVLFEIQQKLKVPKSEHNEFGNYSYRTKGMILEKLKPLLAEYRATLFFTDKLVKLGEWYFVKSTVDLCSLNEKYEITYTVTASGYARHAQEQPKMQIAQVTGSTTSYAQKAALEALFLIDGAQDIDAMKPQLKLPKATSAPKTEAGSQKWINAGSKEFYITLEALKKGQITLQDVKSKYKISSATEARLLKESEVKEAA